MITLYGISNCDTIRKAMKWLENHDIPYQFHDYKKLGVDQAQLHKWCLHSGYENLVNRRGTTWRKLPEEDKQNLDEQKAIQLMLINTSLIKRPVLENADNLIIGFDQSQYESLL